MSDARRYDIFLDGCMDSWCMAICRKEFDDSGEWVRYDDHVAEVERLREALQAIAAYGDDGICPYGCDTPHIARAALAREGDEDERT